MLGDIEATNQVTKVTCVEHQTPASGGEKIALLDSSTAHHLASIRPCKVSILLMRLPSPLLLPSAHLWTFPLAHTDLVQRWGGTVNQQLLEEKGGIQVSPSALTDHCDSRLAPGLLRQSWVCFLPPHTKIAAESQDHCSHSSPRATGPRPALRPLWMGNADQEALVLGD